MAKNIWGEEEETPTPLVDKRTHHKYKELVYFNQNRVDLAQECKEHPELMDLLAMHQQDEFEVMLAQIAAYCEVVLNDNYTPSDLDYLCGILCNKLREKRGSIVFIPADNNIT